VRHEGTNDTDETDKTYPGGRKGGERRHMAPSQPVTRRCYELRLSMDLWEDLERRIRERGVRIDERLALLALLRSGEEDALTARRSVLLDATRKAARRVRDEMLRA